MGITITMLRKAISVKTRVALRVRSTYGKNLRLNTVTRNIASQRIRKLFQMAENIATEDRELSENYAEIARRISMAARIRMPRENRCWICRGCKRLILPGTSCRVRIQKRREPHIVITCNHCGRHMRSPIRPKGRK